MDGGWRRTALGYFALLFLVVAAAWILTQGESFLRERITGTLKDLGFTQARYKDLQLDWNGVIITGLHLAPDLSLEKARLEVDWRGLTEKRLGTLRLDGLRVTVLRKDGAVTLAGLPPFEDSADSDSPPLAWRLERLEVFNGHLTADLEEGHLGSHFEAMAIRQPDDHYDITLSAEGQARPAEMASIPFEAWLNGPLSLVDGPGDLSARVTLTQPPVPHLEVGKITLQATTDSDELAVKIDAETANGPIQAEIHAPLPLKSHAPRAKAILAFKLENLKVAEIGDDLDLQGTLNVDLLRDKIRIEPGAPVELSLAGLPLPPDSGFSPPLPLRLRLLPGEASKLVIDWEDLRAKGDLQLSLPRQTFVMGERSLGLSLPEIIVSGTFWENNAPGSIWIDITDGHLVSPTDQVEVRTLNALVAWNSSEPPTLYPFTAVLDSTAEPAPFTPLNVVGRADPKAFSFDLMGMDSDLRISIDGTRKDNRGEARITLDPLTFAPDGLQPAALSPAHGNLVQDVSGQVKAGGTIAWSPDGLAPHLTLTARDLSLTMDPAHIEGIQGEITLTGLAPLTTPPDQSITAARANIDGTPLRDMALLFQATSDGSLVVDQLVAGVADGYTLIHSLTIVPEPFAMNGEVSVIDVEAPTLIGLFEIPDVTMDGSLGGDLPFRFDGDGLHVFHGFLGNQYPGRLRYRPAVPPAALQGGGEGASLMLEALKDFRYKTLGLGLNRSDDGAWTANLSLEGANPNLMDGHPFQFNINVSGALEAILRRGLTTYQLPETIGRSIGKHAAPKTSEEP
ncbi:Exported protein of unknown function [Magnetospira sp. QH-2]|nr:Exported protein of unknown function [Magnetospira sp. QH-2]